MFRNCQYQALLEIKSEVRFAVNVLQTHLDPIFFPAQQPACSPSPPLEDHCRVTPWRGVEEGRKHQVHLELGITWGNMEIK